MKEQEGESCLCFSVGQSPACQPSAVTLHLKHCTRSPTPVQNQPALARLRSVTPEGGNRANVEMRKSSGDENDTFPQIRTHQEVRHEKKCEQILIIYLMKWKEQERLVPEVLSY